MHAREGNPIVLVLREGEIIEPRGSDSRAHLSAAALLGGAVRSGRHEHAFVSIFRVEKVPDGSNCIGSADLRGRRVRELPPPKLERRPARPCRCNSRAPKTDFSGGSSFDFRTVTYPLQLSNQAARYRDRNPT